MKCCDKCGTKLEGRSGVAKPHPVTVGGSELCVLCWTCADQFAGRAVDWLGTEGVARLVRRRPPAPARRR